MNTLASTNTIWVRTVTNRKTCNSTKVNRAPTNRQRRGQWEELFSLNIMIMLGNRACRDIDLKGGPRYAHMSNLISFYHTYGLLHQTKKPATLRSRLSRTTLQNVEQVLEEESGICIVAVDDLPLSYRYRTLNLKGCATVLQQ